MPHSKLPKQSNSMLNYLSKGPADDKDATMPDASKGADDKESTIPEAAAASKTSKPAAKILGAAVST